MKIIKTDKIYNKCPKCGATIKIEYYSDVKNDIFLGLCEKDSVLFISFVEQDNAERDQDFFE